MSVAREDILLGELKRHGNWRKGEPIAVALTLAPSALARPDLVIAFAVAAQLLGRMRGTVRELHLVAPLVTPTRLAALLRADGDLAAACALAIERAGRVPIAMKAPASGIRVIVGRPASEGAADLWFDAEGWIALIGEGSGRDAAGAPLGAVVGACLVVNELFQLVHSTHRRRARRFTFSAWDHQVGGAHGPGVDLANLGLGSANLAGAGAVAQCALWTAAAAEISLAVLCGDHDPVDDSNLARLPFAGSADIGDAKVDVLARGLEGSKIAFTGVPRRFEELRAPMDRPLLFAVDDDQARATLQQLAPPLAISATTGTLALTIEWSDLDPGYACISCGHPIVAGPSPDELARTFRISQEELAGVLTRERVRAIEREHGLEPGALEHVVGRPACDELNEIARIALGIGGPAGSVGFLSWLAGALLLVEVLAHVGFDGSGRRRRSLVPLIEPSKGRQKDPRPRPGCSCQTPFFKEAYAAGFRAHTHALAPRAQAIEATPPEELRS